MYFRKSWSQIKNLFENVIYLFPIKLVDDIQILLWFNIVFIEKNN